jgi:flavin-dependent dehydrogenase
MARAAEQVTFSDVVIVGGGISGSAAAIALSRLGREVTLLDKRTASRVPIGETLSPACSRALSALGLSLNLPPQVCLQSSSVRMAWGSETLEEEDYSFHYDGPWWHIDHHSFAGWLRSEACLAGVDLIRNVCGNEVRSEGQNGWRLKTITTEGEEFSTRAGVLVDATGRAATIARSCGFRRLTYDKLIAISGVHYSHQTILPADFSTVIEASPEGWWYSSAASTHAVVGTFITEGPIQSTPVEEYWHNQLSTSRHTRFRLGGLQPPSEIFCLSAATIRTDPIATPNLFTIGDAAYTQDPLSSQGIQKALISGYKVGVAINEVLDGRSSAWKEYADDMKRGFGRYLHLRRQHYRRVGRFTNLPFWMSRGGIASPLH